MQLFSVLKQPLACFFFCEKSLKVQSHLFFPGECFWVYPFLQSSTHLLRKLSIIGASSTGKSTQNTKFLLNLYRKGFFTPLGRGIDWCLMCDRFPPFGTNPMMPMLGEPPMGFPDPLRGSLLGLHPYGHPGYGLGLGPILPVPVWRPLAAHPSAVLCNNIGCPCNRSSAAMNELLEMYKSSPPSSDPWRPWYPKHSGKFCCET